MKWQDKSRIIAVVERLPASSLIYYLLQRYVTRSIPRSRASTDSVLECEKKHLAAFHKYTGRSIPDHVFEFGAGWDLCSALVRHTLGVRKQTMVDLNRLASTWQINHVLNYISDEKISHLKDLENLGISYLAPFDARCTGLPDSSVDLICSTNTLEHIPPKDLALILVECRRIMRADGIASMIIDYSDHYSHADNQIGPHNFLQFSDNDWNEFNHSRHFQNRLRHSEYRQIFEDAGFEVIFDDPVVPKNAAIPHLAERFQKFDSSDLRATSGHFVVR